MSRSGLYALLTVQLVTVFPLIGQNCDVIPGGPCPPIPVICTSMPGNLVKNCGFESGSFGQWQTSGLAFPGTGLPWESLFQNSGYYSAWFVSGSYTGALPHEFLTQTVPTVPGTTYVFGWFIDYSLGTTMDSLNVTWNGQQVFSQANIPGSFMNWKEYYFPVLATTTTAELQFDMTTNDITALDDIFVVDSAAFGQTPEPGYGWLLLPGVGFILLLHRRSYLGRGGQRAINAIH